jgi:hypothetical protein
MKKHKKIIFSVFLLSLFILFNSQSYAVQFNVDLTTVDGSYGNYTDIFRIQVDGYSLANQSFGADHMFNDGDTFTETSIFQKISYKTSLFAPNSYFTALEDAGKIMYLYGEGISGYAHNVTFTDPLDLSTYTFDYIFDPGSGEDLGIYIGDNDGTLDYNPADTKIADLYLVSGDGAGDDGFLSGLPNAGTSRITTKFLDSTMDDVWSALGLDLGDLPDGYTAFLDLNTTNQLIGDVEFYGTFPGVPDGFEALINSTGHATVSVVPEPATMLLLGTGILGIAILTRRKFFNKD